MDGGFGPFSYLCLTARAKVLISGNGFKLDTQVKHAPPTCPVTRLFCSLDLFDLRADVW